MCGICWNVRARRHAALRRSAPSIRRAMNDAIAHRGPDGDGFFDDGRGRPRPPPPGDHRPRRRPPADGERRRAPAGSSSTARSTTTARCGRCSKPRAIASAPYSDTETILHAYEEFGPACVERLEGMFAFAIYDGRRRELFAARDRLGKKPFFYTVLDGVLSLRERAAGARAIAALEGRARPLGARGLSVARATSSRRRRSIATSTSCCPGTGCASRTARIETRQYWDVTEFDTDHRPRRRAARRDRRDAAARPCTSASRARCRSARSSAAASTPAWSCRTWPKRCGDRLVTTSVGFGEAAHNELEAAGADGARTSRAGTIAEIIEPRLDEVIGPVDRAPRRAAGRFVGDPDLVCLAGGAAARDRGAERRRRRRELCRLRLPLRAARAWRRRRGTWMPAAAGAGAVVARRAAGRAAARLPRPLRARHAAREPRPRPGRRVLRRPGVPEAGGRRAG